MRGILDVGALWATAPLFVCCCFLAFSVSSVSSLLITPKKAINGKFIVSNHWPPPYTTHYITQKVEHFNYENPATFEQRYLVSDHYYAPGGHVLFYTGNEDSIDNFFSHTSVLHEISTKLNPGPLLVFAEHRYYGKSFPVRHSNATGCRPTKEMYGLSVSNALEDFAKLIDHMKVDRRYSHAFQLDTRIVALGGSYGGMLSAWFRYRYPHLVYGAYAASAPVRMTYHPYGFFSIVIKNFEDAIEDKWCSRTAGQGMRALERMQKKVTKKELDLLNRVFRPCKKFESTDDVYSLMQAASSSFVTMSMLNYPEQSDFWALLPANPVSYSCNRMHDVSKVTDCPITRLASLVEVAFNYTGKEKCWAMMDTPSEDTECSWEYQTCTEMYFDTRIPENDLIPSSMNKDPNGEASCRSTYGRVPDRSVIGYEFSQFPVGAKGGGGSRIMWTNGGLDPWSAYGIHKQDPYPAYDNPTFFIPQGAHHLDLRASGPSDPPEAKKVRAQVFEVLQRWLPPPSKNRNFRGDAEGEQWDA